MLEIAQPLLPLFVDGDLIAVAASSPKRRVSKTTPRAAKPGDVAELRVTRQAFLGLASSWDLSGQEVLKLLGEPLATEDERHERMRALSGIRRSLQFLVPAPAPVRSFLEQPDPAFDGASPLQLMLVGGHTAIKRVRATLAARVAVLP